MSFSFGMFANHDSVRNLLGINCVQGYHFGKGDTDVDDYGRLYYLGDTWSTSTPTGQFAVKIFDWIVLLGVIALPAITLKATSLAVAQKKREITAQAQSCYLQ
jgi:hypothetical protein